MQIICGKSNVSSESSNNPIPQVFESKTTFRLVLIQINLISIFWLKILAKSKQNEKKNCWHFENSLIMRLVFYYRNHYQNSQSFDSLFEINVTFHAITQKIKTFIRKLFTLLGKFCENFFVS